VITSMMVSFDRNGETYSSTSVERQSETDWQFLVRLAREWRCVFSLAYNQDGTLTGIFADPKYLPSLGLGSVITGKASPIAEFEWGPGTRANVQEYSWKNNVGINGSGDNVLITYPNGVPTFIKWTAATDTVTTWVIDQDAINEKRKNTPLEQQAGVISAAMAANSFRDPAIAWAFKQVDQTTAPNGIGYEIALKEIGEPMRTAGQIAQFGPGFPSMLQRTTDANRINAAAISGQPPVAFWNKKVTHTIDKTSYFTDIEVVDTFTISAIGVV